MVAERDAAGEDMTDFDAATASEVVAEKDMAEKEAADVSEEFVGTEKAPAEEAIDSEECFPIVGSNLLELDGLDKGIGAAEASAVVGNELS